MLAFQHGSPSNRAHNPPLQHSQGSGTVPNKHFPRLSGHLRFTYKHTIKLRSTHIYLFTINKF